jgi:hypothetical protein
MAISNYSQYKAAIVLLAYLIGLWLSRNRPKLVLQTSLVSAVPVSYLDPFGRRRTAYPTLPRPKKVYARQERRYLLLELGIIRSSPFIPTIIAYCMYPTEAPRLSLALCVCLVYLALRVSDIVEAEGFFGLGPCVVIPST